MPVAATGRPRGTNVRLQQHGVPNTERIWCAQVTIVPPCAASLVPILLLAMRSAVVLHCCAVWLRLRERVAPALALFTSTPPPQMWTTRVATCWQTPSSGKPSRSSATGPRFLRCCVQHAPAVRTAHARVSLFVLLLACWAATCQAAPHDDPGSVEWHAD
jgi:hypothetical protein